MPVGTGSINRAARTSKKTTATAKNEEVKNVAAEAVSEKVETAPLEGNTVPKKAKAVKENSAPKKQAAKKTAAPKKAAVKETAAEQVTGEKAPELRVYGNETVFVAGNECCHLTEELPVHLL